MKLVAKLTLFTFLGIILLVIINKYVTDIPYFSELTHIGMILLMIFHWLYLFNAIKEKEIIVPPQTVMQYQKPIIFWAVFCAQAFFVTAIILLLLINF